MASKTFLPLGTGQYQAEKARLSKDVDLQGAINSEVAALGLEFDIADNYADDAAAATGGIAIGGLYHTSGTVKVRLT
ncbi:MAG TPA: hypothetical protein VIQ23_13685 [Hanamia sp.]|jgi:hypothetical protein